MASLNRLVELCKKLLDILDVLDEGTAKNKGKILKDLIPAKMNLAKLNLEKGTISVDVAKEVAKECRELAKEMIQCYK